MPIYAYKCTACGHAKDVLQKMSDKILTVCPECHQETYAKQVTAAGFQLKGSGWYVTDFRQNGGGDKGSAKTSEASPAVTAADSAAGGTSNVGSSSGDGTSKGASKDSSESAGSSSSAASTPSTSSGSAASASAPASPSTSTSSANKPASGGSAA